MLRNFTEEHRMNFKNSDITAFSHLNHGNNQIGVRNYNEKLILQLVRNHEKITKAEATHATGLSPNAISVIFKSLVEASLLIKGDPIRGKIGQPSVPMSINPTFAYFLGFKIGRRSFELILMDFAGEVVISYEQRHEFPLPQDAVQFVTSKIKQIFTDIDLDQTKVAGLGVAIPYELWKWPHKEELPEVGMKAWKNFDLYKELQHLGEWPVFIENDATAACGAELVFGEHKDKQDFVYLFIGTLIGGGIVLNGSVFNGQSGNAGGYGPMLVPSGDGKFGRLADHASLYVLEQMIIESGGDPELIYVTDTDWSQLGSVIDVWIAQTARSLAYAVVATLSIIDFEAIIIDGSFPKDIKVKITNKVIQEIENLYLEGTLKPKIFSGSYGEVARAIGAASLPLRERYLLNQNTLLRN